MEFSESHQEWIPVPNWVHFLINFGYSWPTNEARPRRIALISMPCDSAAAGLIVLGALIHGLGNREANDLHGYHEALVRYGRQYLQSCRSCDMRCEPQQKHCGYSEEASGLVRYKDKKLWKVSELALGSIWFTRTSPPTDNIAVPRTERRWLSPKDALDWKIDGEAWPQMGCNTEELLGDVYASLIPTAKIVDENLRRSFSGLCLAGRVAGEAVSREMYSSIRFRINEANCRLSELLTVNGWNTGRQASRTTFFNARTQSSDRGSYPPTLVVADGDLSFLKVLSQVRFQRSDVIGVIHRTIERDNLEAVGNRLNGLHQWYEDDADLMSELPKPPMGISISVLKKRT